MSHHFFLWGMRILAVVSFLLMVITLIYLSPYSEPYSFQEPVLINIFIFEISLFFTLLAVFSLFLFRVRKMRFSDLREKELSVLTGISFRQGFLLALAVLVLLVMQSFGVLIWWDGLLAMGAIIMIELYFLAK